MSRNLLVFVSSPYIGKGPSEIPKNLELARKLCKILVLNGLNPIAPHLFLPEFLDESVEEERERALNFCLDMVERADEVWAYTGNGISAGMHRELERAYELEKPVSLITSVESWRYFAQQSRKSSSEPFPLNTGDRS